MTTTTTIITSTQDKISYLSGSLDFWPGVAAMAAAGGYSAHPWPAANHEVRFVDGPRGVVLDNGTTLPVAIARGATFDVDLEERVGRAIAKEVRRGGANLFAGICVNIVRHPSWGRTQESFSEDSCHLARMGCALTRGVQADDDGHGVMGCVKHFALNSMENARFTVDVRCTSERALREVYLRHFEKIVRHARPASIMSAYNSVEGECCGENKKLLSDILKGEWGFEGFVMTDFIMGAYDGKKAVMSGLDLEMPFRNLIHRHITAREAENNPPLMARIDDAVGRLKRQIARFSSPLPSPSVEDDDATEIIAASHRALSLEVARSSIVLLKNEGGVLPLKRPSSGRRVGVFGPLASLVNLGDRGSSMTRYNDKNPVTILKGITALLSPAGVSYHRDLADLEGLRRTAAECEACVVVVGLTYKEEGEFVQPADLALLKRIVPFPRSAGDWGSLARLLCGNFAAGVDSAFVGFKSRAKSLFLLARGGGHDGGREQLVDEGIESSAENSLPPFGVGGDRVSLSLREEEVTAVLALVTANPRTVVVLVGGSAFETERWIERVPGVLMAFYGGIEGGTALAETLFGENDPGGRLPLSFPRDATRDLPHFDRDARSATYEFAFGYRQKGANFRFPFGYGLSYLSCVWSNVRLVKEDKDGLEIAVMVEETTPIENNAETRPMNGEEVVQVYLSVTDSKVERAARQLVGFTKVRGMARGETREVRVHVPLEEFEYYDETEARFIVEMGPRYVLWVLRHSMETTAAAGEQRSLDVTEVLGKITSIDGL